MERIQEIKNLSTIPETFRQDMWTMSTKALCVAYGRSNSTINRWKNALGNGLKHDGGFHKRGNDTRKQILACLNCPFVRCSSGECARVRDAKGD